MVTAVLEKSKKNTYQNPYVLERCFATSHSEFLWASSKVKYLTPSVRWFQKVNPLTFFHFETTKDRTLAVSMGERNVPVRVEYQTQEVASGAGLADDGRVLGRTLNGVSEVPLR